MPFPAVGLGLAICTPTTSERGKKKSYIVIRASLRRRKKMSENEKRIILPDSGVLSAVELGQGAAPHQAHPATLSPPDSIHSVISCAAPVVAAILVLTAVPLAFPHGAHAESELGMLVRRIRLRDPGAQMFEPGKERLAMIEKLAKMFDG